MDIAAELKQFKDALRRRGIDLAPLSAQAQALVFVSDAEFGTALEAFHLAADAPAYYATSRDSDFEHQIFAVNFHLLDAGNVRNALLVRAPSRCQFW